MDYKYDYYHNSSSNEETETDFSYEIPQTYKKKKVSSYKSVSKIIDKEYLLNITPPPPKTNEKAQVWDKYKTFYDKGNENFS